MALETEFQYFLDHQAELVQKHEGKFLIVRDTSVVGVFNSQAEAYQDASEKYPPGTFLIQHCIAGESAYTQTFNSRVIFA